MCIFANKLHMGCTNDFFGSSTTNAGHALKLSKSQKKRLTYTFGFCVISKKKQEKLLLTKPFHYLTVVDGQSNPIQCLIIDCITCFPNNGKVNKCGVGIKNDIRSQK